MMSSIIEDTVHHCKTELKEKRFYYIWDIVNFWEIYKFGVNLTSDKVENFKFRMCPGKDKLDFYGWIECEENMSNEKNISYSIFLKTIAGQDNCVLKSICMCLSNKPYLLYELPISLLYENIDNKCNMYLSRNNTLTIYFEFFIFEQASNNNIFLRLKTNNYINNNTDIFIPKNKPDSLVTFIINEKKLEINKNLLISKSKVFETLFKHDQQQIINTEMEIKDVKYDIFEKLLFFVQTGYLSKTMEEINYNTMCELFVAAHLYGIEDLKLICEKRLILSTTIQNVLTHLKIAYLHDGIMLKDYTKAFINLYLNDIDLITPVFANLIQNYPELRSQIKTVIDGQDIIKTSTQV